MLLLPIQYRYYVSDRLKGFFKVLFSNCHSEFLGVTSLFPWSEMFFKSEDNSQAQVLEVARVLDQGTLNTPQEYSSLLVWRHGFLKKICDSQKRFA